MKSAQTSHPDKASYKKYCKKLLSHKIILASIIKECVNEFAELDIHYICGSCIEGNPEISEIPSIDENDLSHKNELIQEAFYDLRFYAVIPQTDELIKFIINIDIPEKRKLHSARVKRGMYYSSQLLSMQDEASFTEANCRDASRVYSIWICPDNSGRTSDAILCYKFSEEVVLGSAPELFSSGVTQVVTIYLDTSHQEQGTGLIGLLKTLLSADVPVSEKIETLRNLSEIVPDEMFEKDLRLIE